MEPDTDAANVCRINLSHMPDAIVVQMAIGSGGGAVKCINPEAPSINRKFFTCDESDIEAVKEISIRQILDRYQCQAPILVKMDIEGAEADCFAHSSSWLRLVQGVLVEAHGQVVEKEIKETFSREGFLVTRIGEKVLGQRLSR